MFHEKLITVSGKTLLLNLAGVDHVVDATSAGYTKSVLISMCRRVMLSTLSSIGPHREQLQRLLGYLLRDDNDRKTRRKKLTQINLVITNETKLLQ